MREEFLKASRLGESTPMELFIRQVEEHISKFVWQKVEELKACCIEKEMYEVAGLLHEAIEANSMEQMEKVKQELRERGFTLELEIDLPDFVFHPMGTISTTVYKNSIKLRLRQLVFEI